MKRVLCVIVVFSILFAAIPYVGFSTQAAKSITPNYTEKFDAENISAWESNSKGFSYYAGQSKTGNKPSATATVSGDVGSREITLTQGRKNADEYGGAILYTLADKVSTGKVTFSFNIKTGSTGEISVNAGPDIDFVKKADSRNKGLFLANSKVYNSSWTDYGTAATSEGYINIKTVYDFKEKSIVVYINDQQWSKNDTAYSDNFTYEEIKYINIGFSNASNYSTARMMLKDLTVTVGDKIVDLSKFSTEYTSEFDAAASLPMYTDNTVGFSYALNNASKSSVTYSKRLDDSSVATFEKKTGPDENDCFMIYALPVKAIGGVVSVNYNIKLTYSKESSKTPKIVTLTGEKLENGTSFNNVSGTGVYYDNGDIYTVNGSSRGKFAKEADFETAFVPVKIVYDMNENMMYTEVCGVAGQTELSKKFAAKYTYIYIADAADCDDILMDIQDFTVGYDSQDQYTNPSEVDFTLTTTLNKWTENAPDFTYYAGNKTTSGDSANVSVSADENDAVMISVQQIATNNTSYGPSILYTIPNAVKTGIFTVKFDIKKSKASNVTVGAGPYIPFNDKKYNAGCLFNSDGGLYDSSWNSCGMLNTYSDFVTIKMVYNLDEKSVVVYTDDEPWMRNGAVHKQKLTYDSLKYVSIGIGLANGSSDALMQIKNLKIIFGEEVIKEPENPKKVVYDADNGISEWNKKTTGFSYYASKDARGVATTAATASKDEDGSSIIKLSKTAKDNASRGGSVLYTFPGTVTSGKVTATFEIKMDQGAVSTTSDFPNLITTMGKWLPFNSGYSGATNAGAMFFNKLISYNWTRTGEANYFEEYVPVKLVYDLDAKKFAAYTYDEQWKKDKLPFTVDLAEDYSIKYLNIGFNMANGFVAGNLYLKDLTVFLGEEEKPDEPVKQNPKKVVFDADNGIEKWTKKVKDGFVYHPGKTVAGGESSLISAYKDSNGLSVIKIEKTQKDNSSFGPGVFYILPAAVDSGVLTLSYDLKIINNGAKDQSTVTVYSNAGANLLFSDKKNNLGAIFGVQCIMNNKWKNCGTAKYNKDFVSVKMAYNMDTKELKSYINGVQWKIDKKNFVDTITDDSLKYVNIEYALANGYEASTMLIRNLTVRVDSAAVTDLVTPTIDTVFTKPKDISFEWTESTAKSYNFQISDKEDFSRLIVNRTGAMLNCTVSADAFNFGKKYYWRVITSGGASEVYTFSISPKRTGYEIVKFDFDSYNAGDNIIQSDGTTTGFASFINNNDGSVSATVQNGSNGKYISLKKTQKGKTARDAALVYTLPEVYDYGCVSLSYKAKLVLDDNEEYKSGGAQYGVYGGTKFITSNAAEGIGQGVIYFNSSYSFAVSSWISLSSGLPSKFKATDEHDYKVLYDLNASKIHFYIDGKQITTLDYPDGVSTNTKEIKYLYLALAYTTLYNFLDIQISNLSVTLGTVPQETSLLTPEDKTEFDNTYNTEFTWEGVSADQYTIQISDNANFKKCIISEKTNDTVYELDYKKLDYDKVYYWRVISKFENQSLTSAVNTYSVGNNPYLNLFDAKTPSDNNIKPNDTDDVIKPHSPDKKKNNNNLLIGIIVCVVAIALAGTASLIIIKKKRS